MNTVNLLGRTTRDIELRYTQSGKAVGNLSIAVQRKFKKEEVDFFECTAWGKTAEIIAKYVRKGDQIGITGTLRQETFEKDGQKRSKVVVIVDSFDFIGGKKQGTGLQGEEVTTEDSSSFPF